MVVVDGHGDRNGGGRVGGSGQGQGQGQGHGQGIDLGDVVGHRGAHVLDGDGVVEVLFVRQGGARGQHAPQDFLPRFLIFRRRLCRRRRCH